MANESRVVYELLPDLDAAIINTLPDEGAKLGFHVIGKQCKAIQVELEKIAPITSAQINSRLRCLTSDEHKLVVSVTVQPVSRGKGYQRTPKGKRWAKEVTGG